MLFGLSGYIITYMITNPVFDNFNSYANRKVVYFNSFLEDDFTHSNKILEKTAFDKMELFYAQNKKAESETAFKINKDYYFGFYNSYKKEYSILKFQE